MSDGEECPQCGSVVTMMVEFGTGWATMECLDCHHQFGMEDDDEGVDQYEVV